MLEASLGKRPKKNTEPIGTKHAHYAGPEKGPFKCSNCTHFTKPGYCNHPDVIEDAEKKLGGLVLIDGVAKVSPQGCCNYFR